MGQTPHRRSSRGSRSTPVFGATPEPGERTLVSLVRFDSTHHRVQAGAHAHHDLELLLVERGGGRHVVGDQEWDVRDGDVYLVPPGLTHDLSELHDDARCWALLFSADAVQRLDGTDQSALLWRANALLNPFLAAELDPRVARMQIPSGDRERWRTRVEALRDELDAFEEGRREAIAAHLLLIVVDLARLAADVEGGLRASREGVLADVFHVIEDGFRAGLSARDVAGATGFTVDHLSKLVRARTGRTVGEWILERQMAEARRLLVATDLSVQEVATRCGYADSAYFSRRFRTHHGIPPGRWRDSASRAR